MSNNSAWFSSVSHEKIPMITITSASLGPVLEVLGSGQFPNIRLGATDAQVGISMTGCADHENPGFQPSGVATLAGGQITPIQPPNDGFFEAVSFIGAVPPSPADNWMTGWTAFPQR